MVIVTNTTQIKKGYGHKLIERFDKVGKVESMQKLQRFRTLSASGEYDRIRKDPVLHGRPI